jgi:hypothetical protein
MKKTVYIIGAGFSIEAGAPSQENIIKVIFDSYRDNPHLFQKSEIESFRTFLKDSLYIPESEFDKVPLEDIFTPLDKCLNDNISFRNIGVKEVTEIRELIYFLIGKTLQEKLRYSSKDYIDTFARHLVRECKKRSDNNYRDIDTVSVISTNWDILLDNSIKSIIDREERPMGVVDYCSRISSFNKYDESVKPGLEVLAKGGYNVKLIKLHGSLNWLTCPRCSRIYVAFNDKIAINQYTDKKRCRHCTNNFGSHKSHILHSNMIMPTFLKNLDSTQYKVLWRAAETEIAEADRLVFIGYSLPNADFEMRQLLSRMTRSNAKIEVVDYGKQQSKSIKELKRKYKIFFGSRESKFFFEGAKHYIENDLK